MDKLRAAASHASSSSGMQAMKAGMAGVQAVAGGVAAAAQQRAPETTGAALRAADVAATAGAAGLARAQSVAGTAAGQVADVREKMIQLLEAWVKSKVHAVAVNIVDRLPGLIKDGLDDPEMPGCVKRGKDRLVDGVWPDVREELVWELAVMIDKKKEDPADERKGVDCVRAFFRYHLFPYNKTFWGKLRDPTFVFFRLVSLVPINGVCQAIFLFVFLFIDKSDEYQLIAYILTFKGTQFLSHGFIRMIIGFLQYVGCVTVPATENAHSCEENGPGAVGNFPVTFLLFFIQILLVWVAFFLLPCSEEKGRSELKTLNYEHGATDSESTAKTKGGYLKRLMIYDIFCFIICMGVALYVAYTRSSYIEGDWVVRQALFACQVLYGYLSLPFFLFTIPFLQVVLTHSVPTGYDEKGRCKRFKKPKEKEEPKQSLYDRVGLNKAEIAKVVDDVKNVSMGAASSMLTQFKDQAQSAGDQLRGMVPTQGGSQPAQSSAAPPIVLGTGTGGDGASA